MDSDLCRSHKLSELVSEISEGGKNMPVEFKGNCPKNVNKDAKYTVRSHNGQYVVGITYQSDNGERWFPFTQEHAALAQMVNAVKNDMTGNPGGAFYINEYKQVIVPASDGSGKYYLAGEYTIPLEFIFEGNIISGNAVNYSGERLSSGEVWAGPHAGIPYVLSRAKKDITYEAEVRPYVTKQHGLSRYIGKDQAFAVVRPLLAHKLDGGRIYVNEYCQIFAPCEGTKGFQYIYIGEVNLAQWFPKP